jgi:hypothetical protein
VACLIELVHHIFEGCLCSLLVVRPDPRCSIVQVGREHCLGTIDHEERGETGRLTRGCPEALENRRELGNPPPRELLQSIEDSSLEPLQDHVVHAFDLPVRAGVRHGGPIDSDVVVIAELEEFLSRKLRTIIRNDGVRYPKAGG